MALCHGGVCQPHCTKAYPQGGPYPWCTLSFRPAGPKCPSKDGEARERTPSVSTSVTLVLETRKRLGEVVFRSTSLPLSSRKPARGGVAPA